MSRDPDQPSAAGVFERSAPSPARSRVTQLFLVAAVVLATACSDFATRYEGTVMSEANPEAEGSLSLTLFSRTDTSFSGVIELGPPARGTGSAYAWPEGAELHIVTVGAESGDTIRWISRLTDAGLGGRFEVVGGDRVGQTGTWRARLVQGPPATAATLRLPQSPPLPRPISFWPIPVLIGIAIWLGAWIRRAPGRPSIDAWPPRPRRTTIGGWLAFFAFARTLLIFWQLAHLPANWHGYGESVRISAAVSAMQPVIVYEAAMGLLLLPLNVGGLVLLVRRSVFAPRYWVAFLGASAAYLLLDSTAMLSIQSQLERLVGADTFATTGATTAFPMMLRNALATLVWLFYWGRSERVRETFGAAAFDKPIAQRPPVAAPPAPAA